MPWLQPIPDTMVDADNGADPSTVVAARDSIRLATFAHATSSTSATIPIRTLRGVARLSRTRETPRLASATSSRLCSTLRRNSVSASSATSGRMRW